MDTTTVISLSDKAKKLGPPKGKKLRKLKYNGARRDAGKHEEAAKACSVPALDAMERSVPTLDAMERGSTASPGSQSATSAFGTRYVSDSIVDKTLSWLAFFVAVMPIGGFLIITGVVSGPRHFQKFALWCLTGPFRSSLLGVLLARIPSIVYDFFWNALEFLGTFEQRMWTDSLNPDRRAYLDGSFGRNLVLWDTMRIGDYDLAREIALDPKRKRAACLDGWLIKGAQLPYATNLPLFFNTGSEYHSAWRTAFKRHITAPESVVAKLANGGEGAREKLRLRLEAWLGPGWGSIKPPNFPGSKWLVQPVFETLMGILFDTEELPEDLIEKVAVYTTAGAMYWLLAPSYPPLFQTAGTLAPLRLKEYLYLNHNAAKPDQLRGRAVDWRAMADEVPGVETVTANANGERPPDGSEPPVFCDCMGGCCLRCMLDTGEKNATNQGPSRAEEKVDRLLDSVCVAMLLAATAGTTTATGNVLKKFLHFPQSFYFPQFGFNIFGFGLALNQHDWQPDAEEMAALYRANPTDFVLETLRLACPVAGSHKVLDKPMVCPFMKDMVTLPENTVLVANYGSAHLDPKEWGDDWRDFRPGRAPRDRYLVWNGPYGGSAPRQCPGEELSMVVITTVISAFLDKFMPDGTINTDATPATAAASKETYTDDQVEKAHTEREEHPLKKCFEYARGRSPPLPSN